MADVIEDIRLLRVNANTNHKDLTSLRTLSSLQDANIATLQDGLQKIKTRLERVEFILRQQVGQVPKSKHNTST